MSGKTFRYEDLRAELRPEALRLTAQLDPQGPRASKERSRSRIEALVRLDIERIRRLEAEGRFVWTGRTIRITSG